MTDDRVEKREAKRWPRRLQPAKVSDIDPATVQLAPYLLLALGIVALFPPSNWGEGKEAFSRFIGIVFLIVGLSILAYRRWGPSRDKLLSRQAPKTDLDET